MGFVGRPVAIPDFCGWRAHPNMRPLGGSFWKYLVNSSSVDQHALADVLSTFLSSDVTPIMLSTFVSRGAAHT